MWNTLTTNHQQKHSDFLYEQHINVLTLQGKNERTIEMYSRSLREITAKFDMPPDRITTEHLKQYYLLILQVGWLLRQC